MLQKIDLDVWALPGVIFQLLWGKLYREEAAADADGQVYVLR